MKFHWNRSSVIEDIRKNILVSFFQDTVYIGLHYMAQE